MRSFFLAALPVLSFALLASPRSARAQSTGFALDRFEPSERGSEWFAADSIDLRGNGRPAAGIVLDVGHKPLVLYNADGSTRVALVSDQVFAHAGGSLVLFDRLRLGLSLPIALYQDGQGGVSNGVAFGPPSSQAVGDLRLSADLRLYGVHGDPFTIAAGVAAYAPTGSRADYTSDGTFRVAPRMLAAGELARTFVYAARVSFDYRSHDATFAGSGLGSDLAFAASAGVRVADGRLVVGPEVFGSTVVTSDEGPFKARNTPFEAIVGAHYTAGDFRIGAGVGPGLTRGYGTPATRVLASVEWAPAYAAPVVPKPAPPPPPPPPPPPDPDRDKDGVLNDVDACPDVAGVRTDDPKTNGCPPPPDTDGDGVVDAEDACPKVPGVRTNDPKTNGCPPPDPDRDKDGIENDKDACPDEPGPPNADPKKNGCPKAFVQAGQIKITDQIKFRFNSAELDPAGDPILQAVLKVLTDHPEIKKLRIEGHTDNIGGAAYNLVLSKARAAAVMKWLVKHGVDAARLEADGFGLTKPLAENKTDAGRRENRRVEFHILDPAP